MKSIPMPCSRCSRPRIARISACVVTSRAVVGSSQSSSRGSTVSAPAIMTRWSMPPDSSCGNWRRWRSGSGRPTACSSSSARARALSFGHPWLSRSDSVRKSPMRRIGLMPARGSWNTMDTVERRSARTSSVEASSTSVSPTVMRPSTSAFWGSSRRTALAVSDLPDPDSPTSPTTSPTSTPSDTPSRSGRLASHGIRRDRDSISSSRLTCHAPRSGRRSLHRRC